MATDYREHRLGKVLAWAAEAPSADIVAEALRAGDTYPSDVRIVRALADRFNISEGELLLAALAASGSDTMSISEVLRRGWDLYGKRTAPHGATPEASCCATIWDTASPTLYTCQHAYAHRSDRSTSHPRGQRCPQAHRPDGALRSLASMV